MNKLKKLVSSPKAKKLLAVIGAVCIMAMSCVTCFATDGTGTVTDVSPDEAASQVFTMMAEQLNFTTILAVLGVVIGAALAMVLGWWAIRKIAGALMRAFKSGKFKI